jgi:predicted hotdog family 3-hydroxylacyl-ACP dehydratase
MIAAWSTRPIEALLPHAGRMRLIDRIVACDDARIVCATDTHRQADHPLAAGGVLSAVCGLEYGAQAMAIHGALAARLARPRRGYIAAVRELRWRVRRLDDIDETLLIEAEQEAMLGNQASYRFALRADARELVHGRAQVVLEAL